MTGGCGPRLRAMNGNAAAARAGAAGAVAFSCKLDCGGDVRGY
jgi:hypothetical protein